MVSADRIIQLALAKRPGDRYADAAAMAPEVRSAWTLIDIGSSPRARAVTRLIVLPFRVLRSDPLLRVGDQVRVATQVLEAPSGTDVPASPKAYDLYLRANHLGANTSNPSHLTVARDLYRSCLEEDPAPAWARLGRVYRVPANCGSEGGAESLALAEEAFPISSWRRRGGWLDSLRAEPQFVRLVRQAETGKARAAKADTRAGGERLLGVG